MNAPPVLSITIPTYNRRRFLEQTMNALLPQVTDQVEIVVLDNHSTDDTFEYIQSLPASVRYIRQPSNVGPDRNMISCVTEAKGAYFWLLCDDDLPCSNTVANILAAIENFPSAGMFYLRVAASDKNVSDYNPDPVETSWTSLDADTFLNDISFLFTFASSIVAKRDCVELSFLQGQSGTGLVPAALVLSTVGTRNNCVVSDQNLLYGRGDNSGGYSALAVFSKNVIKLFRACDKRWFSRRTLRKTYNDNLAIPVLLVVQGWPLTLKGLGTLLAYSYYYSNFYRVVAPALAKRLLKQYVFKRKATFN